MGVTASFHQISPYLLSVRSKPLGYYQPLSTLIYILPYNLYPIVLSSPRSELKLGERTCL